MPQSLLDTRDIANDPDHLDIEPPDVRHGKASPFDELQSPFGEENWRRHGCLKTSSDPFSPVAGIHGPPAPLRQVIPGLPRPATFRRVESERRERLEPLEPCSQERRQRQGFRRRALSATRPDTPKLFFPRPKRSAPDFIGQFQHATRAGIDDVRAPPPPSPFTGSNLLDAFAQREAATDGFAGSPTDKRRTSPARSLDSSFVDERDDSNLQEELDAKWILNLSMTFRDGSHREKFFITYAETPNRWRRLTVSCDYRSAPRDSLEAELQTMTFQRDKSAAIFGAIRESLREIKFFDTVTNLKLQTLDDRLHVHVTEDVNEIIKYPDIKTIRHLMQGGNPVRQFRENEIDFAGHLSGFVYKVDSDQGYLIKKEIPGPDMVDEFLYEINALAALRGAGHVIELIGVVSDEDGQSVKGLLIEHARKGALADILYDTREKGGSIPWQRRIKWARQIIQGLAAIHDHGFVQGDFTLSNIVVDDSDNASIIDINRRGCPVGWEPPEFKDLIRSGQRVGMYIGVKSDIWQLGMVLFGLARMEDEPENSEVLDVAELEFPVCGMEVPGIFKDLVSRCLSELPFNRPSTRQLLEVFDGLAGYRLPDIDIQGPSRDDVERELRNRGHVRTPEPDGLTSAYNTNVDVSPQSRYNGLSSSKTSAAPLSAFADDMAGKMEQLQIIGRSHSGDGCRSIVFPSELLSVELGCSHSGSNETVDETAATQQPYANICLRRPMHQDSGFDEAFLEDARLADECDRDATAGQSDFAGIGGQHN